MSLHLYVARRGGATGRQKARNRLHFPEDELKSAETSRASFEKSIDSRAIRETDGVFHVMWRFRMPCVRSESNFLLKRSRAEAILLVARRQKARLCDFV